MRGLCMCMCALCAVRGAGPLGVRGACTCAVSRRYGRRRSQHARARPPPLGGRLGSDLGLVLSGSAMDQPMGHLSSEPSDDPGAST